ncbi:MAG: hypothetical protein M3Q58_16810 [Bacteroidota bacterium]|nr:hypothetical protein [Bacteroidota bacterium]
MLQKKQIIKNTIYWTIAILCLVLGLSSCDKSSKKAGASTIIQEWTKQNLMDHVREWPGTSIQAAEAMTEKYGTPEEITNYRLIWYNKSVFKEIIVHREEIDHNFPMPHKDVLEQTINYEVPVERYSHIATYNGSISTSKTKGTLTVRGESEAMNFLSLNLAHEVAMGKRSIKDAREFHTATVVAFLKGKTPEYTQKLLFTPAIDAGDPDKATIDDKILEEIFGQR